jgi:hypothetical protein
MTVLTSEATGVLYGVVRFHAGSDRAVRDTVVTFATAEAAELFALENGWDDYEVSPIWFFGPRRSVTPRPKRTRSTRCVGGRPRR